MRFVAPVGVEPRRNFIVGPPIGKLE